MSSVVFCGMLSEPMYKFELHKHDTWEIICYTEGTGVIVINDKPYQFGSGSTFVMPPGTLHSETSEGGFRNVFVTLNKLNIPLHNYVCLQDSSSQLLQSIMTQMFYTFNYGKNDKFALLDSLAGVIEQFILSSLGAENQYPEIEAFENILAANISNKSFVIGDALSKQPMSPDYFRRHFKNKTGKTPVQYLTDLRIKTAIKFLEYGFTSIAQIADITGFGDPFYFSRVFKKHTGISPSQWKKK